MRFRVRDVLAVTGDLGVPRDAFLGAGLAKDRAFKQAQGCKATKPLTLMYFRRSCLGVNTHRLIKSLIINVLFRENFTHRITFRDVLPIAAASEKLNLGKQIFAR